MPTANSFFGECDAHDLGRRHEATSPFPSYSLSTPAPSTQELALPCKAGSSMGIVNSSFFDDYEDRPEFQRRDVRVQCLTRRLSEKSAQSAQLSSQIAALQGKSGDASFNTERLQIKYSGLDEELRRIRASWESRAKELEHANNTITDLRREAEASKRELSSFVASKREAAISSQAVANTYDANQLAQISAKDAQIKQTATQVTTSTQELAERTAVLARLEDCYDSKRGELSQVQAQIQRLEQEVVSQERAADQKDQVRAQVHRLQEELRDKTSKLSSLSEELAQEQAVLQVLKGRLTSEEAEIMLAVDQLDFQQARMTKRIYGVTAAIASKEKELELMTANIAERHRVLQEKEACVQASSQQLHQDASLHAGGVAETSVEEEVAQRFQKYYSNLSLMLTQANMELADKQAELAGKNTEVKRLAGSIESRAMTLMDRTQDIDALHAELARKKELLLEHSDEADLHNSEMIDEAQAMIVEKGMQFRHELEAEYSEQIGQIQMELQHLTQKLMAKTDVMNKQESELGWEAEQLRREVRAAGQEEQTLTEMVQCLLDEEKTKDSSIRAMEQNIQALEKEAAAQSMGQALPEKVGAGLRISSPCHRR